MSKNTKNKYLKKDFPLSSTLGWIDAKIRKTEPTPLKELLEEGSIFQEMYDYIQSSPTSSMVLKEKAREYKEKREALHDEMLFISMGVVEYMKEKGETP